MRQVPKGFLDNISAWLRSQARHFAEDPVFTLRVIKRVDPIFVQQVKDGERHSISFAGILLVH